MKNRVAKALSDLLKMSHEELCDHLIETAFEMPELFVSVLAPIDDTPWQQAALSGQKIVAIKEYRTLYKVSLKESKDAVEEWLERHMTTTTLGDILADALDH